MIRPDFLDSTFAHVVHALLLGGVGVYAWQAVAALVRRPRRVAKALRKTVNAAWLSVLFLLLTQPNPVPYLRIRGCDRGGVDRALVVGPNLSAREA